MQNVQFNMGMGRKNSFAKISRQIQGSIANMINVDGTNIQLMNGMNPSLLAYPNPFFFQAMNQQPGIPMPNSLDLLQNNLVTS